MKEKMKQVKGVMIVAMLVLSMVMSPMQKAEAADVYTYGYFAVTAMSSDSVTIDYRNVYYHFVEAGAQVYGYRITLEDLDTGSEEMLIKEAGPTEIAGTVTGLTPGHTYFINVRTTYAFPGLEPGEMLDYVKVTLPATGVATNVDTVTDTGAPSTGVAPSTPSTPNVPSTPTDSTIIPQPSAVSVSTPTLLTVKMGGNNVGTSATSVACSGYEFGIFNRKTGRLMETDTSSSPVTTFYGVSRKNVCVMRVRAYDYDANGNKVYSAWSAGKIFVPQPKLKSNACKVKKNSITIKWNKVTGAKNYTLYMRKRYGNKWYKVKTVNSKKSSCTIKKFRGKKINAVRQNYEVKVKATAKIGGKIYNSTTNDYVYTYTYTRYY